MVDPNLNSVTDMHGDFVESDNDNMGFSNLNSDTLKQPACVTALEPSAREDLFTETPSLCKWKKMARDIIIIDSPM